MLYVFNTFFKSSADNFLYHKHPLCLSLLQTQLEAHQSDQTLAILSVVTQRITCPNASGFTWYFPVASGERSYLLSHILALMSFYIKSVHVTGKMELQG